MANKQQSDEFREKAHAKKQHRIKQSSTSVSTLHTSQTFLMATKEGPDYSDV